MHPPEGAIDLVIYSSKHRESMARPLKNTDDKLSKILPPIRCTEGDYFTIRERAEQTSKSISQYVREAAVNSKIIVKEGRADFELIQELRRSGHNLNQLTKRYHATQQEPVELRRVLDMHHLILKKVFDSL